MNLEKFTDRAKGFIQSAQTGAIRMNHQRITPEHLLKALLEDKEGMAAGLIQRAGGNPQFATQELDKALAASAYLTGDDFQACDIVMAHVLGFIRDDAILEGLEHLISYRDRCFARAAYQKALAIQTAGKPAGAG